MTIGGLSPRIGARGIHCLGGLSPTDGVENMTSLGTVTTTPANYIHTAKFRSHLKKLKQP